MSSGPAGVKSFLSACALGVLMLVASMAASYTIAQQALETKAPAAGKKQGPQHAPAAPPTAAAAPQPSSPISLEQALYLIRSTLLTLNDANRSGNYTVLRDLAAPEFQARNTAADLSQSFADLRRRNFDFYGAALLAPQLTAVPALDAEKRLRLTGFIPTRPLQINFDLSFEVVGEKWRLFGIAVQTPPAPPQPQADAPQAAPSGPQKNAPAAEKR